MLLHILQIWVLFSIHNLMKDVHSMALFESLYCVLKSHFLYFWFTLVSVSQMWKSQDILEVNCVDLTLSILILLRTEFLWPRLCVFVRKAGRK